MAGKYSFQAELADWWLSRIERPRRQPKTMVPLWWLAGVLRPFITPDLVEGIQLVRLRRTIAYAATRSPFYRDHLRGLSVDLKQVRSLANLAALPFTTSEDLTESERFLCVPREEIGHVFTTSGTTAEPKCIYFTFDDFRSGIGLDLAALGLLPQSGLPFSQHVVALIALPLGLWIGSYQAQRAVERWNGLALPVGMPSPEEILTQIARFQPNVMFSSPSYMGALTRAAEEKKVRLPIHFLLLGGELLLPEQERYYAEYWQAQVYNIYGTSEIGGGQAIAFPGCRGLHVDEMKVLAEIVDPETARASDEGELVFTTLDRQAMPLLRYRSGDIASWVECTCGLPLRAFVVKGRIGEIFIVGDLNLSARVVTAAIAEVRGLTGRVDIILDKVGSVDQLEILAERLPGYEVQLSAAHEALVRAYPELVRRLAIGVLQLEVQIVDRLEPTAKAFRIVDRRHL